MSAPSLTLWMTPEFIDWREQLHPQPRARLISRFDFLRSGHFGDSRSLGDGLFELRWRNGMRVYYSRRRVAGVDAIVVWGGFKGTQDADIAKARRLKDHYEAELADEA